MISFLIALVVISAQTCGFIALADSFVMPEPSLIISEDGSRIFAFNPDKDESYPEMGVYLNKEPLELEYLISFGHLTFESDFFFSSDMRYFVYMPTISQDRVIYFYEGDTLLQSYRIPNLVYKRNTVTYSVSMAMWYRFESRNLDRINNTFTITTLEDITFVFDVTTGDAIEGVIIDTDVVWDPFNYTEHPPMTNKTVDPEYLIQEHQFAEGPGTVILDSPTGEIVVDVYFGDIAEPEIPAETQLDKALIIGIIIMALVVMGLVVVIIVYRYRKRAV